MASILDALLITLELDGSRFDRGAKQTREGLRRVSEASATTDKDMQAATRRMAEGFGRVRNEVLGLLAVVTAGRGIKQFVADITGGDAATGRLAASLNMSTQDLAAWQGAAERAGGTAAGIASAFQAFGQDVERFKLTGQGGEGWIPYLDMLGVKLTDDQGKIKSMGALALDLADKFKGMDAPRANFIGAQFHFSPAEVGLLRQGRGEIQRLLAEQAKLGVPTDADALGAQRLLNDVKDLQQAFTDFGRGILREVTPALDGMMRRLIAWIEENGPRLKTEIADRIREFVAWLERVDWTAVLAGIGQVADKFRDAVGAIEGMDPALRAVLGFVAGAWLLGMLGPIARVAAALVGLTAQTGTALAGAQGLAKAFWAANAAMIALEASKGRTLDEQAELRGKVDDAVGGPAVRGWLHEHGLGWLADRVFRDSRGDMGVAEERHYRKMNQDPAGNATDEHHRPIVGGERDPDTAKLKPVLDLLGKAEGTDKGRGYNESLAYGKWTDGAANLVGMTLDQIDALQTQMLRRQVAAGVDPDKASSALGRFQFTRTTLRDLRGDPRHGLRGDQLFDEAMQDRLARLRIEAGGGLSQAVLAGGWASIPDPGTGRSRYGQGLGATAGEVQSALAAVQRTASRAPLDGAPGGAPPPAESEAQRLIRETREMMERHRRAREQLDRQSAPAVSPLALGGAAQRWGALAANGPTSNDNSVETSINGPITIHTAATDARGIAGSLRDRLASLTFAGQANRGLA